MQSQSVLGRGRYTGDGTVGSWNGDRDVGYLLEEITWIQEKMSFVSISVGH